MPLLLLFAILLVTGFARQAPTPSAGTIEIDASRPGAPIPSNLYGIFFEEISHAGDGGLYAELIQNRGFEDARLPPMCKLENGFVVPPRTPHFDTGKPQRMAAALERQRAKRQRWTLDTPGGARGVDAAGRRSAADRGDTASLQVDVEDLGERIGGRVAILNEGFWGINVVKGAEYEFSFLRAERRAIRRTDQAFARERGRNARWPSGVAIGNLTTDVDSDSDRRFTATRTDPKARLALSLGSTGRVWIDFVSLFPKKTWKNRPNGLRLDIARADRRPETRLRALARRLFRRRHHHREPAAVEASRSAASRTAKALTAPGATGRRTASGTTSSCSSARISAPTRCSSSTSASPARCAAGRSCLTRRCPD